MTYMIPVRARRITMNWRSLRRGHRYRLCSIFASRAGSEKWPVAAGRREWIESDSGRA